MWNFYKIKYSMKLTKNKKKQKCVKLFFTFRILDEQCTQFQFHLKEFNRWMHRNGLLMLQRKRVIKSRVTFVLFIELHKFLLCYFLVFVKIINQSKINYNADKWWCQWDENIFRLEELFPDVFFGNFKRKRVSRYVFLVMTACLLFLIYLG